MRAYVLGRCLTELGEEAETQPINTGQLWYTAEGLYDTYISTILTMNHSMSMFLLNLRAAVQ